MNDKLYKLIRVHNADLLVLEDMEWNGMLFAREEAEKYAEELVIRIAELESRFQEIVNNKAVSMSSGKHLSAVLYGGVIVEEYKIPVGHYKTGVKAGQVKYGNRELKHVFPRLIDPIKNSESKRGKQEDGSCNEWSVSYDTLLQLKCSGVVKKLITIILEWRKLEKLRGTYLVGYPALIDEKEWEGNVLHPNFNQCIVATGRLSSSNPNAQNQDDETKKFIVSRYAN